MGRVSRWAVGRPAGAPTPGGEGPRAPRVRLLLLAEQLPGDPGQLVDSLVGGAVQGPADMQLHVRAEDQTLPRAAIAGGGPGRRLWRRRRDRLVRGGPIVLAGLGLLGLGACVRRRVSQLK